MAKKKAKAKKKSATKKKTAPRTGKARAAKRAKAPKKGAKRAKAKAQAMDPEAMMQAWQKAATPAAGHKRLEPIVGAWQVKTSISMDPSAPPEVSAGTSEHRWVLGGRYVEQRYQGTSMGMPFEGIGYTGYDNAQGKYVGTWMDSFGTGMMPSVGVGRPSDSKLNFAAECVDPTGATVRFDCMLRVQDHDHHSFEMWTKAPNGRRYRAMLIEYTRK